MSDDIKLPELPAGHGWLGGGSQVFSEQALVEYARAAVLADRERMKGKVDALRLNAERYRWLRNNANSDEDGLCAVRIERWSYGEAMLDILVRHELDEAIDAARAAGGGE